MDIPIFRRFSSPRKSCFARILLPTAPGHAASSLRPNDAPAPSVLPGDSALTTPRPTLKGYGVLGGRQKCWEASEIEWSIIMFPIKIVKNGAEALFFTDLQYWSILRFSDILGCATYYLSWTRSWHVSNPFRDFTTYPTWDCSYKRL